MARIVFHAGYMKTASTLLQGEVFPHVPDCDVYSYASGFPHRVYALRDAPDDAKLRALADDMRSWTEASGKGLQLFSWEGLVGDYLGDYRDAAMMFELMRMVAPEGHVLLVIRRQGDLANSLYKQALHRGHWSTMKQFLNFADGRLGPFEPAGPANIAIASLDFDAAVRRYEEAFGAERVHVLVYEWLKHDPERFWTALAEVLNRSIEPPARGKALNVGYNAASARLARRLNRLFRTPHNPRGLLPYRPLDERVRRAPKGSAARKLLSALNAPFDPRWLLQSGFATRLQGASDLIPPEARRAIERHCAASNRALDQRRGLGLAALDYY